MPLLIRRADRSEADEISRMVMLSKRSNGYDDAFMAQCVYSLRVTEKDILTRMVWVAYDGAVKGAAILDLGGKAGHGTVSSFFVHPAAKRQGIGRRLFERLLSAAKSAELSHLQLDADPAAVPFYQALGFRTSGQSPSDAIPGRMLPLMELELRG